MTPARFLAAALTLVALSAPLAAFPDRYKHDGTQATDSDDPDRQKRASTSWTTYSRWKPAAYQLGRPYFIPVYGAAGKAPIYFPPQKLNINPGTPQDNPLPKRPFVAPGYLPPTTEATTMTIIDRFLDADGEDRPVWGNSVVDSSAKGPSIIPTRPPRPPSMQEFPPLVHDISSDGTNALAAESVAVESLPRPMNRITSTASPVTIGPSNCVWAIVSCCSASNTKVPDSCFEQRGCPGPFWGSSPCESDYAKAAIDSALNYYGGA